MPSEKENNNQTPKHKATGLELSCQFNSVFSEEQAKPEKRPKIGVKKRTKGCLKFFAVILLGCIIAHFIGSAWKFYAGFSKVGVAQFTARLGTTGWGIGFKPESFPPLMEITDDAGIAFITNYRFFTKSALSRHTIAEFSIVQYVSKNDFLEEDDGYIRASPAVRTLLFDFTVDEEDSSIFVTIRFEETPKGINNQPSSLIVRKSSENTIESPDSVVFKKGDFKVPPNTYVLCDWESTVHFYKKINNDMVFTENTRMKSWSNDVPVFAFKGSLLFPGKQPW